jgi:peptidoglycan/xylan/chitin deacetylase (PgdA/CDA1 family)
VREDLCRSVEVVGGATGVAPSWFRPPYGVLATSSVATARGLGLPVVLWTSWGRDWRAAATSDSVLAEVSAQLSDGATVLLHDSDCTSDPGSWRSALGALAPLSALVDERGWEMGPLAEHGL